MQEKWEKCFIKYLIIKVFVLCWPWGVSKKKSQYLADRAGYCDFAFCYMCLFDAFFYRLQYIVEYLIGVAEGDEIAHRHAV